MHVQQQIARSFERSGRRPESGLVRQSHQMQKYTEQSLFPALDRAHFASLRHFHHGYKPYYYFSPARCRVQPTRVRDRFAGAFKDPGWPVLCMYWRGRTRSRPLIQSRGQLKPHTLNRDRNLAHGKEPQPVYFLFSLEKDNV